MMAIAWMVLLAAAGSSDVMDEVHQIPAGDWKYTEIHLARAARISASYEVLSGSPKVSLALMRREDLQWMPEDLPGSIAMTGEGQRGSFSDGLRRQGEYVVVLDNQDGKQEATVHLRIWLNGNGPEVLANSARRKATVAGISLILFGGIVTLSARRLRRAMQG